MDILKRKCDEDIELLQAEIDELKSKIKPRPAYDYQRKRIVSLQAEIDEIVDVLKEAVKTEYLYQRMSKIVIPKMKALIAKHKGDADTEMFEDDADLEMFDDDVSDLGELGNK